MNALVRCCHRQNERVLGENVPLERLLPGLNYTNEILTCLVPRFFQVPNTYFPVRPGLKSKQKLNMIFSMRLEFIPCHLFYSGTLLSLNWQFHFSMQKGLCLVLFLFTCVKT